MWDIVYFFNGCIISNNLAPKGRFLSIFSLDRQHKRRKKEPPPPPGPTLSQISSFCKSVLDRRHQKAMEGRGSLNKLCGVALLIIDPHPTSLTTSKRRRKKGKYNCYHFWHITHNIWHMTHDTWHMTYDTWQVGEGEVSLKISLAPTVLELWCFEDLEEKDHQLA